MILRWALEHIPSFHLMPCLWKSDKGQLRNHTPNNSHYTHSVRSSIIFPNFHPLGLHIAYSQLQHNVAMATMHCKDVISVFCLGTRSKGTAHWRHKRNVNLECDFSAALWPIFINNAPNESSECFLTLTLKSLLCCKNLNMKNLFIKK